MSQTSQKDERVMSMSDDGALHCQCVQVPPSRDEGRHGIQDSDRSFIHRMWVRSWFQIYLISLICFCCPGMYNALGGLGGSGQVDPKVTALFLAGPIFHLVGPRACLLLGGWTYALYSGSLLHFNHHPQHGNFVIAAGAILGVGASFLWVSQGAIMTSYVQESHRGRAIAAFWVVFNLGGGVGSLASFGLNFHSKSGTVSDSTYIALMVIMLFGWILGTFICPPSKIERGFLLQPEAKSTDRGHSWKKRVAVLFDEKALNSATTLMFKTMADWRVALLVPLFFCANVFYSYQQNDVNGMTFNIRTRSLNGALYWIAQMFGGLIMGYILDLPKFNRCQRAKIGWAFLICSGMCLWGGGYAFQIWANTRMSQGLKQDIDFKDGRIFLGPMFLYIFYGAYDAFWQSFSYWLIGTKSNSPSVVGILVGAYKTFQSVGGAMAWRVNALNKPPMTQLVMNWALCIGALIIATPAVWAVTLTNRDEGEEAKGEEKEKPAF